MALNRPFTHVSARRNPCGSRAKKIYENFIAMPKKSCDCLAVMKNTTSHHVIDHWGQFHGNFRSYDDAASWIEQHENTEFGLQIIEGEFAK